LEMRTASLCPTESRGDRRAEAWVRGHAFEAPEGQTPVRAVPVDLDQVPLFHLAGQEPHGQGVLNLSLDQPLQRPRSIRRVIALGGQVVPCCWGDLDGELPVGQ